MKNIARLNGNLDDIKTKNNGLIYEINSISINDQKLRTDIDNLNNILTRVEELKNQAENSYSAQFGAYQEQNDIEKFINNIIGLVRSIFY